MAPSPFAISGAAAAAFDAGYTINLANLAPTGTLSISVDGVVQQATPYTTPPATATVTFDTSYSAGCHLVTATDEDASANPLGVALFPAGVAAGACDPGMAAGGVAVAGSSTPAGPDAAAFAVNATLTQGGTARVAALLVAMLPGNPTPVPVKSVTASYDVRGVGLTAADSITVVMMLAPGTPASSLTLAVFDPVTRMITAIPKSEYSYDATTGTVTLVLNASSFPRVTDLTGTTFWLVDPGDAGLPGPGSEDGGSDATAMDAGSTPDATTSFDAGTDAGTDATVPSPDATAPGPDAAESQDAAATGNGAPSASGGCNCDVAAAPGTTAAGALLVAGGALSLALRRRRSSVSTSR
jgi:MYXO-CTERM domain-containing protein